MSSELCTPPFGAPLLLDGEKRQTDSLHPAAERAEARKADDVAIRVENLSKCYQIYDKPRDRLLQMLTLGRRRFYREFWALRGISFDVKKGETVGIIGRNGSGKSTLLQLICGTLNPTSGSIQSNGRIAALLELGSGFNPEFTGRENVYLNGSLLGLDKEEIDTRFEDIEAFADIGDFIEQPVKTYSSGMVVRLAFAVAINVDPQILVIDEALSVGDELFQRKCFSRIEAIRAGGATILFVSHSGGTVVELCDRAVLLDGGEKLADGAPKQIVGRYQKLLYVPAEKRMAIREQIRQEAAEPIFRRADGRDENILLIPSVQMEISRELAESFDPNLKPTSTIEYESHGAYIESPLLQTLDGERVNNLTRGKTYRYCYKVQFAGSATNVRFGMLIKTVSGIELGGSISAVSARDSLAYVEPGTTYSIEFLFRCSLNPGVYFLNAGVIGDVNGSEIFLHRLIDIAMFRVLSETETLSTGTIDFCCQPKILLQQKAQ